MKFYAVFEAGTSLIEAEDMIDAEEYAEAHLAKRGGELYGVWEVSECPEEYLPISEPYCNKASRN